MIRRFLCRFLRQLMPHDKRHLSEGEEKDQNHGAGNLNATQTSLLCVRQTISFKIASRKKKLAQRTVSRRQPRSVRLMALSRTIGSKGLPSKRPPKRRGAEGEIKHRRLHLDEAIVLQIKRQRAEDQN